MSKFVITICKDVEILVSKKYSTLDELQRHLYDSGDMIIDGTFKYIDWGNRGDGVDD